MKRIVPVFVSVAAAFGVLVSGSCLGTVSASLLEKAPADDVTSWNLNIVEVNFFGNGNDENVDTGYFQRALDAASNSSDPDTLYHIVVPAGTYYIDGCLYIYSNTYLELEDGATVIKTADFTDRQPMLCNSGSGGDTGYSANGHICIEGGTWDSNAAVNQGFDGCFYLRHSSDIILKDVTFTDCINHMLNVSGSRNVMIDGCTFTGAVTYEGDSDEFYPDPDDTKISKHRTIEAIHLDFTNSEGEPGAGGATGAGLDGTPVQDITIQNCTFSNVFRGVGTHHTADLTDPTAENYASGYGSNISIINNTFSDIATVCCSLCSYSNVVISGNTATDVGSFITAEDVHGLTVSDGNTATLYPASAAANNEFIQLFRMVGITGSDDITIYDNTFDPNHAVEHGIRIEDSATVSITGCNISNATTNSIRLVSSTDVCVGDGSSANVMSCDGTYDISIEGSTVTVTGNTMTKGIDIQSSTAEVTNTDIYNGQINIQSGGPVTVRDNYIDSPDSPAVFIHRGTDAVTVENNTLYSGADNCIYITAHTADAVTINDNVFCSAVNNMICVDSESNNIVITDNTFDGSGNTAGATAVLPQTQRAISVNNSTVSISGNEMSGFSQGGIILRNNANADIDANLFTDCNINVEGSVCSITDNEITGAGIYLGTGAEATVSGNTIISPSDPAILINGGSAPVTIENNDLDSGNQYCMAIYGHTSGTVTVYDNNFISAASRMIFVGEGNDSIVIDNNTFNGTSATGAPIPNAIWVNNSDVTISNNTIEGFSDNAVAFRNQASGTIEGNTVTACGGITVINGGSFTIDSNTMSDAPERLIYIQNSSGTITGNTLSNAARNGIELYDCGNIDISNNTISDMGSENYNANNESNGVRIIDCSDISVLDNTFSNIRHENIWYNRNGCTNITVPEPETTTTPTPAQTSTTSPTPAQSNTTTPTPAQSNTTTPTPAQSNTGTPAPTQSSTTTPTPAPEGGEDNSSDSGVDGFVERLYTIALGRSSDPAGQQSWVNTITSGQNTGADVARGFLYSDEFLNKNMTNEDFVRTLYRTFFDREADQGGLAAWVGVLDGGESKQNVIEGFINSTEWANVCVRYGIPSGGTGTPSVEVEPNQQTIDFATRLYTTCLNRNADQGGLMAWARQLANQRDTGTGAARGFFFSSEFTNQNVSNGEYVTRLYRTFMGREPDQAGYDAWVGQLDSGVSREEVFNGFAASQEFTVICGQYGIIRG